MTLEEQLGIAVLALIILTGLVIISVGGFLWWCFGRMISARRSQSARKFLHSADQTPNAVGQQDSCCLGRKRYDGEHDHPRPPKTAVLAGTLLGGMVGGLFSFCVMASLVVFVGMSLLPPWMNERALSELLLLAGIVVGAALGGRSTYRIFSQMLRSSQEAKSQDACDPH